MVNINNENLSVIISEKGAELQSLQYDQREYVWQGDSAYWAKHSPILFPVVGELKEGKYFFENKEYALPRHGFARDRLFEWYRDSASSVTFILKSDEGSLAVYPFQFTLKIIYKVEGTRLFCSYVVENNDTRALYFSIGGHPAFNLPLVGNLEYSDYSIWFNSDKVLERHLLFNGLTGDDTETLNLPNNQLPMEHSLFYDDAIVLKKINSTSVKLSTYKDPHGLTLTFEGFPYFGIWAARDAPFVCLEPWCGIADNIHHDQQLIHKEGINELQVNESWQRTWSIEVF